MEDMHRVLSVPLHSRPAAEWGMWLRAKLRTGRDVLGARLRVDENALKMRQMDVLPELIRKIREARESNSQLAG